MSFVSRNHPQQVAVNGANDEVDDRGTTWDDFRKFDAEFGPFTLDVAAAPHNAKCEKFYTRADDGLKQSWAHEAVWCNPPYSNIGHWVEKAWEETPYTHRIAMLLPANRCEQRWWQYLVEPFRDGNSPADAFTTRFLPGRMRFDRPGVEISPKGDRPPFGCVLLVWG
jgi:phage N-6-adenine-methyltransferase